LTGMYRNVVVNLLHMETKKVLFSYKVTLHVQLLSPLTYLLGRFEEDNWTCQATSWVGSTLLVSLCQYLCWQLKKLSNMDWNTMSSKSMLTKMFYRDNGNYNVKQELQDYIPLRILVYVFTIMPIKDNGR
jgi:hypothetical protein